MGRGICVGRSGGRFRCLSGGGAARPVRAAPIRRARDLPVPDVSDNVERRALSFEEYWRASKSWEQKGLTLGAGRALVNAGFLTVEDLQSVPFAALALIPRVGRKSLAVLLQVIDEHGRQATPKETPPKPTRLRVV